MKEVTLESYNFNLSKLRGLKPGEEDREVDSRDFIEITLDQIPQGGFTPKDIRDRNRIQEAIDKTRLKVEGDKEKKSKVLKLEDSDYDNLKKIVNESRWASRDKELMKFLDLFKTKD